MRAAGALETDVFWGWHGHGVAACWRRKHGRDRSVVPPHLRHLLPWMGALEVQTNPHRDQTFSSPPDADLDLLAARVAAEGGDLEADWAAVEAGRSTTAVAKAGRALGGRAAPPPPDQLLAPPSNPKASAFTVDCT